MIVMETLLIDHGSPVAEPADDVDAADALRSPEARLNQLAGQGWLSGRFQLDPESGRIVDAALRRAREQLFHERREAADADVDVRVTGRRVDWADAWSKSPASHSMPRNPPARRERSASTCSSTPPPTCPAAGPTPPIPRCLLDKLTCHSTLVPTFVEAARPVSVGRALRIVPDRTRRLILHRDANHCRIPWCQRTRWLDVHHLVHWANGGRDSNRQRDN